MRFRVQLFIAAASCLCLIAAGDAPHQARSVHLHYPSADAALFYNQVTIEQSQRGTYFCVCGFSHGYFGVQEQGSGKKVVIFSVWDPGKQNDPKKVADKDRVEMVEKADDVRVGRFGNEGTGGQSFFDYPWNIGETYRFAIKANVQGEKTAYAAWFYLNETKTWKHLVTFRTQTGGDALKGLYSFVEDFRRDGKSMTQVRRARYTNGWARSLKGEWRPLTAATFTGDSTPLETIDAGVVEGGFFLQTGGDTVNHTPLKTKMTREAGAGGPPDVPKD